MKNTFGVYVIQKALLLAEGDLKDELAIKIKEQIPFLSNKNVKPRWNLVIERYMQNKLGSPIHLGVEEGAEEFAFTNNS